MRYIITTIIAFAIAVTTNAQSPSNYQMIRSSPAGDLILQLSLREKHGIADSASPIEYGWFTVTNKYCMVNLPKDEYACFAQMFDSASNNIPLRESFANLGSHFFDLKYPSTEQPWSAIDAMIRIRPAHGTCPALGEIVFAGQKTTEGRSLSSLENIFQMKKTGIYKVRLQFQVYERIYKGGQIFTYKLERFEPVEFSVTNADNTVEKLE